MSSMAARVLPAPEANPSAELVALLQAQVAHFQTELSSAHDELKVVRVERDLLRERVRAFERTLYAAKSEARGAHQRDMFFNEAEALAPAHPSENKIAVPAHQRAKRGRKPLDPALPREVVRYELPEGERVCPTMARH